MTHHASGATKKCLPHFIQKCIETKLNKLTKIITHKNQKLYRAYDVVYHMYAHEKVSDSKLPEKQCNDIAKTSVTEWQRERLFSNPLETLIQGLE